MNNGHQPETAESNGTMNALLPSTVKAEAHRLAMAAIDQLRDQGIALDQGEAADFQKRVELEILKALTAQRVQAAITDQMRDPLDAIQRIIGRVTMQSFELSHHAVG
jgi:hypothetical protein